MESSRHKETGKAKNDPEKNLLRRLELTWGTAERDEKREIHGEK